MAFPVVENTSEGTFVNDVSSVTVTLPSGVTAGELLLGFIFWDPNFPSTIGSVPSGWTALFTVTDTVVGVRCIYKTAAGGDSNPVQTFSANTVVSYQSYRISGASGNIEATTGTATVDPPSETASWGSADNLFIAGIAYLSDGGSAPSAPTSYGSLLEANNNEYFWATATRNLASASDNPGAFGGGATVGEGAVAFTIVIEPGAATPNLDQKKYRFFEDGDELPHIDVSSPAVTFGSQAGATASSSIATISSMTIGTAAADRIVLACLSWEANSTITGVTIGGITATRVAQANNTAPNPDVMAEIWVAAVPTGTTANVVVTFNTGNPVVHCSTVYMTGVDPTPTDSGSNTGSAATIVMSDLVVPTGGVGIACFTNATDTTAVTWTGATERSDVDAGAFRHSAATTTTAGANNITADGATAQQALCGVAYGPLSTPDGRTPLAAENTGIVRNTADPFGVQIRFENSGGATTQDTFKLQYRLNGGTWTDVTGSSSVIRTVATADYADGDDVLQYFTGSGTFVTNNNAAMETDGEFVLAADLGAASAVELHATLEIQDADVSDADDIELRVVQTDGTVLNAYTVTPTIEVNKESSDIAVTGALASQAADVDGTVGVTVNATGALTSQGAATTGAVGVTISVSGALQAQAPVLTASMNTAKFTGALQADASVVSGAAGITVNATGALTVGAADVDGTVGVTANFTGALASGVATVSGDATTDDTIAVDGALQAQGAVIAGTAGVRVNATGALASGNAAVSGIFSERAVFSGALVAGSAQIAGTFYQNPAFQGALQAQAATIEGVFSEVFPAVFTGTMQSGPASVSGAFSRVKVDRTEVGIHFPSRDRFRFRVRVR